MHAGGHRFEPVHLHQEAFSYFSEGRSDPVRNHRKFFDNLDISSIKTFNMIVSICVTKLLRAYGGCLGVERR